MSESSGNLFGGLVVCGLMFGGYLYFNGNDTAKDQQLAKCKMQSMQVTHTTYINTDYVGPCMRAEGYTIDEPACLARMKQIKFGNAFNEADCYEMSHWWDNIIKSNQP